MLRKKGKKWRKNNGVFGVKKACKIVIEKFKGCGCTRG